MDFNINETETSYGETQISPIEDLMREHGVLKRILLIYTDIISRLRGQKFYDPFLVYYTTLNTASITKKFIEEYHQILEEKYIFSMFQQNRQYFQLVRTLLKQHTAARCLTATILQLLSTQYVYNVTQHIRLAYLLSLYIRMYEPHSAREDTVLFPAFHNMVSEGTFKELGETFEKIEEQKFGENGFQSIVQQIVPIEEALGIYNLGQFTPNSFCLHNSHK